MFFNFVNVGLLLRVIQLLGSFAITRFVYQNYALEEFSLWLVILSFGYFLSFADLGILSVIVNRIISSRSTKEVNLTPLIVTFSILTSLTILILSFGVKNGWLDIFLENSLIDIGDGRNIIFIFLSISLLNILFSVGYKIQFASGRVTESYVSQILASTLQLFMCLVLIQHGVSFSKYVYLYGISTLIIGLIVSLKEIYESYFFKFDLNLYHKGKQLILELTLSFKYLALQVAAFFGSYADIFILSTLPGVTATIEYGVAFRIASALLIANHVISAAWPKIGVMIANGDRSRALDAVYTWYSLSILYALLISTFYYCGANYVIKIWLDHETAVYLSEQLKVGVCFWVFSAALGGLTSAIMKIDRFVNVNLILYCVASIVSVLTKLFVIEKSSTNMFIVTATCYLILYIIPSVVYMRSVLSKRECA